LDSDDSYYRLGKQLKPALSVISRVVSLHTVWPGDGISYNHKHTFSEREVVATVPF
jgi:alanine racemase